jgi:basic amino acid/polyamine antiporter, APA family
VVALRTQGDTGLVRAVGPQALAASIINTVVGAGIFAVPAALAACIGPYAPLAFVVCAVAVGSVAICFAEGGSRVPTSGGVYGTIAAAFGPLVGYVAGVLLLSSDALACGSIAAALADVATTLIPPAVKAPLHAIVIVGVIGGIALVNVAGVAHGARFVYGATLLKLVAPTMFIVVGAHAVHAGSFAQTTEPTTQGLGRALILALFAFSGMEAPLSASGEVSDPSRTIPRALAVSMIAVTALYIAVQVVAQGILGPALGQSAIPLADAMARLSPWLRAMMLGGAALSMFGWIGSDILGTPRILFAFAKSGMLPRALGRVHSRTHTPHVAILTYAVLTAGIALSGTFAELAVLSTLALAPLYIGGCAAAWKLARRGVAEAGAPLGFRWLGSAMTIGIASMLVVVTLASRAEILGLAAVLGGSTILYLTQSWMVRRAKPKAS